MKRTLPVLLSLVALATQAAAQAAPAAQVAAPAPEEAFYTNNVVQNAGFEKNLVGNPEKGWSASCWRGMDADVETGPKTGPDAPVEGRKALRIHVGKTVKYSRSELEKKDWDEFRKGGTVRVDGKEEEGPPYAEVEQIVPVRPGAKYALRFRWRSSGLYLQTTPGRERGEVVASFRGDWLDRRGEKLAEAPSFPAPRHQSFRKDPEKGWATYSDPDFADAKRRKKEAEFLVPPPAAAFVRLRFSFACRREKAKPEFWVDRFEFSEVPSGAPAPAPDAGAR